MPGIAGIRRWFRLRGAEGGVEREVEDELTFHLEARAEELMAGGLDRDSAVERARREFGDVAEARAQLSEIDRRRVRRQRRRGMVDDVRQDVRHGLRALRRRPSFVVVAVLTLGLGIGAASSIFAVVDAVLLRPLPFPEPDRLVLVWGVAGPERDIRGASFPEVGDWRERTDAFSTLSVYDETGFTLSGMGAAEVVQAETVSPGYFEILGAKPFSGRFFLAEDDVAGITPPVVISHAFWQRRFGGSPETLGRSVTLDGRPAVVVGIAEPGFHGLSFDTDIWATLLPFSPGAADDRGSRWLAALGRLAPGVSRENAGAALEAATVAMEADYPETNADRRADLFTLHEYFLDSARVLMLALLGSVGLLLVIACVNVLNLQLVRGLSRDRELAVRQSLGARRGRVVRQLLTESLLLAFLGGLAGLAVAWWGTRSLVALVPSGVIPAYASIGLDGRVLAVTAVLVMGAGVLSGMLPALRGSRREPAFVLRSADRGSVPGPGRGAFGTQQVLVAVEVGLAVALMLGAAVMIRSVRAQLRVDPGFEPGNVVAARVFLPGEAYPDRAARTVFVERVLDGLRGQPGVLTAAVGSNAPLRGSSSAALLRVPEARGDEDIRFYRHHVTADYFDVLGIEVIRGRGFEATDVHGTAPVVVVSRAFAEKLWPGRDGTGEIIEVLGTDVQVVGVTEDVRYRDLTTDLMDPGEDPDVWFSYPQIPAGSFDIVVRHAGAGFDIDLLRRAVADADPSIPLFQVSRLEDSLAQQTSSGRFGAVLLGLFGASALVLAAIGLFGVMSFVVSTRSREIAIRIALGSSPRAVIRRVLARGFAVVGAGVAAGLLTAAMAGRLIRGILFGVSPLDPLSVGVVLAVLGGAAFLANTIPAARAARTDPRVVLRGD